MILFVLALDSILGPAVFGDEQFGLFVDGEPLVYQIEERASLIIQAMMTSCVASDPVVWSPRRTR